ncbi:MAG: extracellular solute-binding protein [Firmicutes bacterium]|nr:extracellular solute-binding protein [Bacillota bacterium]
MSACKALGFIGRRIAVLGLLVVLSAGLSVPASGAAKTKVRLWDFHIHDKKYRTKAVKEFNKKNPDIEIEYTSQVNSVYPTVLQATWATGDPPDLFNPNMSIETAIKLGWVIPIDDVAPSAAALKAWVARFPEGQAPFVEGVNMFKGKIYSWPVNAPGAYMVLYYNKNLFREAGIVDARGIAKPPEDWAELREYARKITAKGNGRYYGIVRGVKNGDLAASMTWTLATAAGWVDFFNMGFNRQRGKFDMHTGVKETIELWLAMKKDGSIFPGEFTMDEETARRYFANEKAGMLFDGWWTTGGLLAYNPKFSEFDVILPPPPERGSRKAFLGAGSLAGSSEYVVSSKVKNKAAVWKVIQFLTSEEYQVGWVKAAGGFSVFPEYNKPEYFGHPTMAKIALLGPASYRMLPPLPEGWQTVADHLAREMGRPDLVDLIWGIYLEKLPFSALADYERRATAAFDRALAKARAEGVNLTKADFVFPDWDPAKNYDPQGKKK